MTGPVTSPRHHRVTAENRMRTRCMTQVTQVTQIPNLFSIHLPSRELYRSCVTMRHPSPRKEPKTAQPCGFRDVLACLWRYVTRGSMQKADHPARADPDPFRDDFGRLGGFTGRVGPRGPTRSLVATALHHAFAGVALDPRLHSRRGDRDLAWRHAHNLIPGTRLDTVAGPSQSPALRVPNAQFLCSQPCRKLLNSPGDLVT